MARPEGFEPPTFWSVAKRSIQLSQGRTLEGYQFFMPQVVENVSSIAKHFIQLSYRRNAATRGATLIITKGQSSVKRNISDGNGTFRRAIECGKSIPPYAGRSAPCIRGKLQISAHVNSSHLTTYAADETPLVPGCPVNPKRNPQQNGGLFY